jgi:Mg2+ and Co2+ transporter CorA
MKKALLPVMLILAAVCLLAALAYFYEKKWGLEGPFPSTGHHH